LKGFTLVKLLTARDKTSPSRDIVDVRLEFKFKENVSANSTTYCFIIHDRVIEYSPLSNVRNVTQDYVNYHHQKNILSLFLIYEIKSKIFCDQAQSQKVVHYEYCHE